MTRDEIARQVALLNALRATFNVAIAAQVNVIVDRMRAASTPMLYPAMTAFGSVTKVLNLAGPEIVKALEQTLALVPSDPVYVPPTLDLPATLDATVGQVVNLSQYATSGFPLTWSAEPSTIGSVSADGKLTITAAGEGPITITIDDGHVA